MKKLLLCTLFMGLLSFSINCVFACDCGCQNDACKCSCHKECPSDCKCDCHKGEKCTNNACKCNCHSKCDKDCKCDCHKDLLKKTKVNKK